MEKIFFITTKTQDDIVILNFTGLLDGNSEDEISNIYKDISEDNQTKFILNFKNVTKINSTGIAILLGIVGESKEKGQTLAVCNLTSHFQKIFDIVGLFQYVQNFENLQQALQFFKEFSIH